MTDIEDLAKRIADLSGRLDNLTRASQIANTSLSQGGETTDISDTVLDAQDSANTIPGLQDLLDANEEAIAASNAAVDEAISAATQASADGIAAGELASAAADVANDNATAANAAAVDAKNRADAAVQAAADAGIAAGTASSAAQAAQQAAAAADTKAVNAATAAANAQTTATDAGTAAATAAGIANGKGKVIYSTTAPTGTDQSANNLWINTSGTPALNTPNRWSGSAWVPVTDKAATDAAAAAVAANTAATNANTAATNAATAATNAQTTANGKNQVTYSTATPSDTTNPGTRAGDIWFVRNGNGWLSAQYEWSGSTWIVRSLDSAILAYIDAGKITAGTLDANRIGANSITATHLAADSVTSNAILAGTIQAIDIAASTITGDRIAAATLSASLLIADTLTSREIGADAILARNIKALQVTATHIAASTITGDKIAANTITAANIKAGTITANEIAANTITATQLNVNTLNGITLTGVFITGGRLRTSADPTDTAKSFVEVYQGSVGIYATLGEPNGNATVKGYVQPDYTIGGMNLIGLGKTLGDGFVGNVTVGGNTGFDLTASRIRTSTATFDDGAQTNAYPGPTKDQRAKSLTATGDVSASAFRSGATPTATAPLGVVGRTSVNTNGSGQQVIPHSLGVTPSNVFLTVYGPTGSNALAVRVLSQTAANFTVVWHYNDALWASQTLSDRGLSWFATI